MSEISVPYGTIADSFNVRVEGITPEQRVATKIMPAPDVDEQTKLLSYCGPRRLTLCQAELSDYPRTVLLARHRLQSGHHD